jgi:hypothetical protein
METLRLAIQKFDFIFEDHSLVLRRSKDFNIQQ